MIMVTLDIDRELQPYYPCGRKREAAVGAEYGCKTSSTRSTAVARHRSSSVALVGTKLPNLGGLHDVIINQLGVLL